MAHWAERYVGRPFVEGRYDCADLVVDVLRERFGRALALPAHAVGSRAQEAQIAALGGELAVPTAAPAEGDGVLMRHTGVRSRGHHLGVWVDAGEPSVLHCARGIGTCLHPLRTLAHHQLELVGVFAWT